MNLMDQAAIARDLKPDHDQAIETVRRVIFGGGVSSVERLDVLLALTRRKPAEVFWPGFHDAWPLCDDTWHLHERLLLELIGRNREARGVNYLDEEARAFFDRLPDPVPVFRGCSLQRTVGVSWTTDRDVACGFARGHRGIRVPSPIVASGLVAKRAVFGVTLSRNESEVILDATRIADLRRKKI
jgi:hypothetical protein